MKLTATLFSFQGRIGRLAFIGHFLPVLLIPQLIGKGVLLAIQEEYFLPEFYWLLKPLGFFLVFLLLASCVSLAAIATKRLHDLDQSGWPHLQRMLLAGVVAGVFSVLSTTLALLPIVFLLGYPLFLIIMLAAVPGQTGANDYGPPPGKDASKGQSPERVAAPGHIATRLAASGFGKRSSVTS